MAFTLAKRYTENTLLGVLALAPIFVLTVKGWTTLTLVLAAVLSLALLLLDRNSNLTQKQVAQDPTTKNNEQFWVWLMIITFASPVLAVLISQSLRHDWVWRSYDAPRPGLVYLDIEMPGMGGQETLARLRAARPDLRIVVSSGYSEVECLSLFQSEGISGFLQKPYTVSALGRSVKAALNRA